jgi:hypothetical protein
LAELHIAILQFPNVKTPCKKNTGSLQFSIFSEKLLLLRYLLSLLICCLPVINLILFANSKEAGRPSTIAGKSFSKFVQLLSDTVCLGTTWLSYLAQVHFSGHRQHVTLCFKVCLHEIFCF